MTERETAIYDALSDAMLTHLIPTFDTANNIVGYDCSHPIQLEHRISYILYELQFPSPKGAGYYYWNAIEDINRPGKFEGERAWVPLFYQLSLDGWHDDETSFPNGEWMALFEDAREICQWHGVEDRVAILIDEQGFVHGIPAEDFDRAVEEMQED